MFVVDRSGKKIKVFNLDGKFQYTIATLKNPSIKTDIRLQTPQHIEATADNLWIVDSGQRTVFVDHSGNLKKIFRGKEMRFPKGIAVLNEFDFVTTEFRDWVPKLLAEPSEVVGGLRRYSVAKFQ